MTVGIGFNFQIMSPFDAAAFLYYCRECISCEYTEKKFRPWTGEQKNQSQIWYQCKQKVVIATDCKKRMADDVYGAMMANHCESLRERGTTSSSYPLSEQTCIGCYSKDGPSVARTSFRTW